MWIHEISVVASWYSLVGMAVYGLVALGTGVSILKFSRFNYVLKSPFPLISMASSIFLCITLLVVDIDHLIEFLLLYFFIASSFLYPSIILLFVFIQKIRNYPLVGYRVLESIEKNLEENNDIEAVNHLKLLPLCDKVNDTIIMKTLCDRRPSVRMAAVEVGEKLGVDPKLTSIIKGNYRDFENLAVLKDKRLDPYLIDHAYRLLDKAEQKKGKKRSPILLGALSCLKGAYISNSTISRIVRIFENSDRNNKDELLRKLHTFDENGAKIYAGLLSSPKRKASLHAAKRLWEASDRPYVSEASWEACRNIFWNKFHRLAAQELCCNKANVRKKAAIKATMFSGNAYFINHIKGEPRDFESIALYPDPWLLESLLPSLQANDDEAFFAAVQGVTAILEHGTLPDVLIRWLEGMTMDDTDSHATMDSIPVSPEILDKFRDRLGKRVEKGLLNADATIRMSMARTANALGMKISFLTMISGDENDFHRIAASADPQLQEKLIRIVKSGDRQALPIIRGLMRLWTRSGVLSKDGRHALPPLIQSCNSPVVGSIMDALIDSKDTSTIEALLKNHDDYVAHRISKRLTMAGAKAKARLGEDCWEALQSMMVRKQTAAKGGNYPRLNDGHFRPNLVDTFNLQPSGYGSSDFQMAIEASNTQGSDRAEKLFRNALNKGLDQPWAGYARAQIGQICLQRDNLAEAVRMFVSVLEADKVLYESAHEAACYLSAVYEALGRHGEVAGLKRITVQTSAKLGVSFDPNVAARVKELVKKQLQKKAAASTDKLVGKSIKALVAECEWHFENADRYEAVKSEFKRRENDIVRPIGKKLHQVGGMALMRSVYEEVEKIIYKRYQKGCASALEMKWNGIGEWRG